jgi:hypothetical protein
MNIKEAITKVLTEIPKGQRLPYTFLTLRVMNMVPRTTSLVSLEKDIRAAISQGVTDGWLSNTQGRLGGVMLIQQDIANAEKRLTDVFNKLMTPTEAPCKVCGNKNDLGVKKCWSCECADPCGK